MNYSILVTLPISTAAPLTATQKTEAASRMHSALSQAHDEHGVFADVGCDDATETCLFEIDEARVTVVEGELGVYVLGFSHDDTYGDIVGVFSTLEAAQKEALETVWGLTGRSRRRIRWEALDSDAPNRLVADHDDIRCVIESHPIR